MTNPARRAVAGGLSGTLGTWANRRRVQPDPGTGVRLAHRVLDHLAAWNPTRAAWRPGRVLTNQSEFRCLPILDGDRPVAILKLARGPLPEANLALNAAALRSIASDPRLASWRHLAPALVDAGEVDGVPYAIEGWVTGTIGDRLAEGGSDRHWLLRRAAEAIGRFRASTLREPTDMAVADTVHRPAQTLARSAADNPRTAELAAKIERAEDLLASATTGRPVAASHTDYWLGNVFFSSRDVTGIVDWSGHRPLAVADIDLVTLVLTARLIGGRGELAEAVVSVLDEGWSRPERDLLHAHGVDGWCVTPPATLLAWLWLVAGNTGKGPRFSADSIWFRRNVTPVLAWF